jgi:hypothetical protein
VKINPDKEYGFWTPVSKVEKRGREKWKCRCRCGIEREVFAFSLINGRSESCGCLKREKLAARETTHGLTGIPEYWIWAAMKYRCKSPRATHWEHYGGRGISVCERWLKFENFYADMGPRPSSDHSIDRIDNDGNYEPGNCRWATQPEQTRNCSRNAFYEYDGRRLCMTDLSKASGVRLSTLRKRIIVLGWPVEEAVKA